MTIERFLDLDALVLAGGAHSQDGPDMCVMEAVAYVAGEPWSDHPRCASKVIATFLRSWNDALDNEDRQMLKPLIPRLVGSTGTPEQEEARSWVFLDWLIRTYTPVWLELAGLTDDASMLRLKSTTWRRGSLSEVMPHLRMARHHAAAAWAAARIAAGDAAWAAAGDAARDAAWAAAGDADGDAAWAAAWDADGDAAWAAAWAAAGDALRPTVVELQASALALVESML